ncbi:MAG: acyloxyacyl hydrolase [Flavobacteriales bacterium]|nr:acyloxyacyl hydrolase [Flavobacteriales bacterium]
MKASLNLQYGFALPEYSFVSYFTDSYIKGFEVNVIKETVGKNQWERIYNYPEVGVSIFHTSLGNDSLFGKATAVNYFFKLKLIDQVRFSFYNRTGIGLGYLTERFDLNSNKSNVAIGSHFNVHFSFKWGVNFRLADRWVINGGLSFDHFSNGNTVDPNRGLNNFTGFFGTSYYIGNRSKKIDLALDSLTKKNYWEIFINLGGKQTRSLSSGFYMTNSISASFSHPISRVFHLGIGTDLFYDSSTPVVMNDLGKDFHFSNSFQTGLYVAQQFIYNKIRIALVEGVYIGLKNVIYNKSIYTKGLIQYSITKRFSVRITMKSHLQILDYPEFGIGVKL